MGAKWDGEGFCATLVGGNVRHDLKILLKPHRSLCAQYSTNSHNGMRM